MGAHFHFPPPTHGPTSKDGILRASHGDAIAHLPDNPVGEYYVHEKEAVSHGGTCLGTANAHGANRLTLS